LFLAELTALDSPRECWLPTSRLIAPAAPGNHELSDGTNTGSEEEKWTADDDAGPVPEASVATWFDLSEGGALCTSLILLLPEDWTIMSPFPADEGEGPTPLIVPEATFVGPLVIMGAELKKIEIVKQHAEGLKFILQVT